MMNEIKLSRLERIAINFFTPVDTVNNCLGIMQAFGKRSMYHFALRDIHAYDVKGTYFTIAAAKNDRVIRLVHELRRTQGIPDDRLKKSVLKGVCAQIRYRVAKRHVE